MQSLLQIRSKNTIYLFILIHLQTPRNQFDEFGMARLMSIPSAVGDLYHGQYLRGSIIKPIELGRTKSKPQGKCIHRMARQSQPRGMLDEYRLGTGFEQRTIFFT